MADNYSIVTDVNAGNSLAVLDQIINKIHSVESAIGQAGKAPLAINTGSMSGGLTSFLNSEKGNFRGIGQQLGQSMQMGMQQQFGMMGGVASSAAGAFGAVGIAAAASVLAIGAVGAAATQAAMKWEDMKTSIGRTTGLGGENLEDLMSQLQDLRMEFGVTGQAAADMVQQAGSIGVGQKKMEAGDLKGYKQEILDFTKATTILQGAWGMSAEATSSGIGKMGSVTLGQWNIQRKARGEEEMSWADYAYKVGGTTDNLANAMGSSEEEIVTAMKGSSGAIAKWAPDEKTYGKWEAMASFLIHTGASAGEAGTQIERVAQKMSQNSDDVAKVMGIDQGALSAKLKTDFMGTVQDLGATIAAMPPGSRPDLFKMFGLEGAAMIEKVVADIEAGTGTLQSAMDLALKPGNVTKGYEDVADNASKQFARIAEAYQVSLEKMGGQGLPFITDIAKNVADAWIKGNEEGSKLFEISQGRRNASWSTENGGLVGSALNLLGMGGEYSIGMGGIAKKAAEEKDYIDEFGRTWSGDELKGKLQTVTKDGIRQGMEEGAKEGSEKAADAWQTAFDVKIKAGMSSEIAMYQGGGTVAYGKNAGQIITGMTEEQAIAAISYQQSSDESATDIVKTMDTFFGKYYLQKYTSNTESTYPGGTGSILDESGKVLKTLPWQLSAGDTGGGTSFKDIQKNLEDVIKPVFLDLPKYMKSVKDNLSSTLTDILSDGVVKFEEKGQLKGLLSGLDMLAEAYPIEFSAANLPELRDDVAKTFYGVPITFDTGEAEANFAIWLQEQADLYVKIAKETGQTPLEVQQKARHEFELDASARSLMLLGKITSAVKGGDVTEIGALPEITDEFEKLNPEVASTTWYMQLMQTATIEYQKQVVASGGSFKVLDDATKSLGLTDLRTSVASDILGGSLLRAASAADVFSGISVNAGMLSSSNNAWAQSRISDVSARTNVFSGSYTGATPTFSGFGAATVATANDFGGLLMGKMGVKIPHLAGGGKVTEGGLAFVGEKEIEYVIRESQIPGLYPKFAKADKGSMQYLMGEKMFEDYPAPGITQNDAYQWAHYPNPPTVAETNTQYKQTAWLSDKQTTSGDMYSNEIRAAQLAGIGKGSIVPWFAKGESETPKFLVDALMKLSPQYESTWKANKGGTVPKIGVDTENIKINDKMTLLRDPRSDSCIALLDAPYLQTTDPFYLNSGSMKINEDVTLLKDPRSDSCIRLLDAPYLSTNDPFYLASGSMPLAGSAASNEVPKLLSRIEDNTKDSTKLLGLQVDILSQGIFETGGSLKNFPGIGGMPSGALVTGLSKEGYVIKYDPNSDTCEGLPFNAPDPGLVTSNEFLLGITNPKAWASEDEDGWGGQVATPANERLAGLQDQAKASYKQQQDAAKDAAKIATNTGKMATDMSAIVSGGTTSGGLVVGGLGGGGGGGLYGNTGGSFWGGLSVGGGGGWVGAGQTSGGEPGWFMSAYSGAGGHGAYATGGFADDISIFGESGREAAVPISDRAAGLRILPQVMRELGVRSFAKGGFSGGISAAIGPSTINLGGITIYNAQNMDERKLSKEIIKQVEQKFYKDRK